MSPLPASDAYSGRTVGHYRILEQIGEGGMGEVYRAEDERLRRSVAIKVLPQRLVADEVASRRFVREARIASQVVHPYVATVFDVLDEDGHLYLVMELIEGYPLSRVLLRDDLPREDRLQWAIEIVEGVCAIHRIGLVHRDIKPGNVMITPDKHVKVMDFGLARHAFGEAAAALRTTEAGITREGIGVGTLLYMSPEQLRAQPVDRRSDLFSLGILLYELISGVHPFKKDTAAESATAILNETPCGGREPDSLSGSGPVRDIVMRLLEKQPEQRFQTGEEVLAALRALAGQASVPRWVPARRVPRLALVAVAALLAAAAWGAWWLGRPPTPLEPRLAFALVPFADRTGEANGPVLAGMAADFLSIDLDASRLVRSVGPRETTPFLGALGPDAAPAEIARQVARGTTVDYVLVGTLYREGGVYLGSLAPTPARSGLPELPEVRGRGATVVELAEALGAALRGGLPAVSRIDAWRDARAQVADLTSASPVATLFYEKGLAALREAKLNAAVGHFEQAVESDTDFVLAHARLAEALHEMGYGRRARDAAERAVQLLPGGRSLAEQKLALEVRATRAEVFSRTAEAAELGERLVELFPDDPGLLLASARALREDGKIERALERVQQARDLDPIHAALQLERARIQHDARDFDGALKTLEEAERLFDLVGSPLGVGRTAHLRGELLLTQERWADAESELQRARDLFASEGNELLEARSMLDLAHASMMTGRAAVFVETLDRAVVMARDAGDLGLECDARSLQGVQRFLSGDLTGAEPKLRGAVDCARQLENDWLLITPLSNLGGLLAYAGRLDEARVEVRAALEVSRTLGNRKFELKALRELSDMDYQAGDIDAAREGLERILEASADAAGAGRTAAWTHLTLAEIHERRGWLESALGSATSAIDLARRDAFTEILGYGLLRRGETLAALGRFDEATREIDEAAAIAAAPAADLRDLGARCVLARAVVLSFKGDAAASAHRAEEALAHPGVEAPAIVSAAHALACQGWSEAGQPDKALGHCRAAVEHPAASTPERTAARSVLGQALLRSGQRETARQEAEEALRQARTMGMLLPVARAAAVLIEAEPESDGAEAARAQGRQALEDYLRHAPPEARDSIRSRQDVRRLSEVLQAPRT